MFGLGFVFNTLLGRLFGFLFGGVTKTVLTPVQRIVDATSTTLLAVLLVVLVGALFVRARRDREPQPVSLRRR